MDAFPTLMPFSHGYYLVEDMYVWPTIDIEVPRIHEYFYGELQTEVYGEEPAPILFRHPGEPGYFGPMPAENLPMDVLALPLEMADAYGIRDRAGADGAESEDFLLAKPAHASRIVDLSYLSSRSSS